MNGTDSQMPNIMSDFCHISGDIDRPTYNSDVFIAYFFFYNDLYYTT